MIAKFPAPEVPLLETVALNHGAHGAVEEQDARAQELLERRSRFFP
jgi:hypothetical protein